MACEISGRSSKSITSLFMSMPAKPRKGTACDLVTSQINFGLAYIQEARSAYKSGNAEYGDLSRTIAWNAYSAAVRFAARLTDNTDPLILKHIAKLETELDTLWSPEEARNTLTGTDRSGRPN